MRFSRRTARFAVLGCGPSGLFAATALEQNGHQVDVFSVKRKSEMFGTQYLHAPIPELTDGQKPITVEYHLIGTAEDYREKVYGVQESTILTSVQALDAQHLAWDIRAAYDRAWDRWEERINDTGPVGAEGVKALLEHGGYRKVVSTIPANRICSGGHRFEYQNVWAAGDAPERGRWCPVDVAPENTVLCNGSRDTGWYRQSNVFGYKSVEWPYRAERRPPLSGLTKIAKPVKTDCDCLSREGLIRLGRYGTWTKGVLAHTSYTQAAQL